MSIELKDKLVTLESLGAVYQSEVEDRNAAISAEATARAEAISAETAARTEAIANEVTARNAAIVEAINQAETGAPTKVELVSQMTDPDKNYLYIGEEQGYNSGHIYYLVDGVPVDKGVFGGTNIDDTLTISGQAADAKVTGDKIEEIKEDLTVFSAEKNGLVPKAPSNAGEAYNYTVSRIGAELEYEIIENDKNKTLVVGTDKASVGWGGIKIGSTNGRFRLINGPLYLMLGYTDTSAFTVYISTTVKCTAYILTLGRDDFTKGDENIMPNVLPLVGRESTISLEQGVLTIEQEDGSVVSSYDFSEQLSNYTQDLGFLWNKSANFAGRDAVLYKYRNDGETQGYYFLRSDAKWATPTLDVVGDHWKGKSWYAYGTSITNIASEGKYATELAQMSGLVLNNKGISGGGIGDLGAYSKGQVYDAICNITDGKLNADLITLETGANDCRAGVPLGTIYDTGRETLSGCLNDCLRYLQANTNAQIAVFNSPATTTEPTATDQYYEWAKMVEEICYINRVHYINANCNLGYAKLASSNGSLYIVDSIHQTELGGYIYAGNIWSQLKHIPLFYTTIPSSL